jgi:hypothetical protein
MYTRPRRDHIARSDPVAVQEVTVMDPPLLDYFSTAADLDTLLFDYFLYS